MNTTTQSIKALHVGSALLLTGALAASLSPAAFSVPAAQAAGDITGAKVDLAYTGCTYDGESHFPTVNHVVTSDGQTLTQGSDFVVTYADDMTDAGKHTVTVTGVNGWSGSSTATLTIKKASASARFAKKVVIKEYGAKKFKLSLTKASSSKAKWKSSKKKVATVSKKGYVSVHALGSTEITARLAATKNYKAGKASCKVKVVKPKVGRAKVWKTSAIGHKSFKVKWLAATNANAYQVRWRTKGGVWKVIKLPGAARRTAKITGLSDGTTYKVQVRGVKRVGGKSFFGKWSKTATQPTLAYTDSYTQKRVHYEQGKRIVQRNWSPSPYAYDGNTGTVI